VVFDGAARQGEPRGDCGVPEASRQQREHLHLPVGQASWVRGGGRPRPAWHAGLATRAQSPREDRSRSMRSKLTQHVERTAKRGIVA